MQADRTAFVIASASEAIQGQRTSLALDGFA
jgi:hypothetical protein